ncbi:MAG: DNA repair and recombination protein RadB [Thermoplasmatota archaeon]
MNELKLNCAALDELLGGGIEPGIITKIYGETGTGKTNICLQASKECGKNKGKVAYIDSEGVSIERLHQMCMDENFEKIFKNILFFSPNSFKEQEETISKALKIKGLKLIIVDSISFFYRLNLEEDREGIMRSFTRQVAELQINCRQKNLYVILVEQVYSDKNGEIKPFTNRDTDHMIKTVIKLEKKGIGKRQATCMKHRSQAEEQKKCFSITARGLQ